MDNAIKEAISRKRAKAGMDPAMDPEQHSQRLDEEDHADLAPDIHSSHISADGEHQNVNPTRPDKAGFSSEKGVENARDGKDEHIYPQENLTDVTKQPRKFNDKNVGRLMAGDGSDPQHDDMGVDTEAKDLKIDSPANQANHKSTGSLTSRVQAMMAKKQGVPGLAKGDNPDGKGSDAPLTARAQMKNQMTPGAEDRGGLQTGKNDNQRYAHKPMSGARAKMMQKLT